MEIRQLTLFTSRLREQEDFYNKILEIPTHEKGEDFFMVQIGLTLLTFKYMENATNYHFAINIPSNKINEALNWLKQRVKVLPFKGSEIADFSFWNAEAIYFYDADKNIVEFIARKNLKQNSPVSFNIDQVISISEMGLPVSDVKMQFDMLNEKHSLELFSGNLDLFAAVGDENGLFIIIDNTRRKWIPKDDVAYSSPFIADIFNNEVSKRIEFSDGRLEIYS